MKLSNKPFMCSCYIMPVIWTVDDDPISENLNLAQIVRGAASVAKDCLDEGYWIAQRYREQQGH